MSRETEHLAWKAVGGLLVLLQLVVLGYCHYIVTKIDSQGGQLSALTSRVVAIETVQSLRSKHETIN